MHEPQPSASARLKHRDATRKIETIRRNESPHCRGEWAEVDSRRNSKAWKNNRKARSTVGNESPAGIRTYIIKMRIVAKLGLFSLIKSVPGYYIGITPTHGLGED